MSREPSKAVSLAQTMQTCPQHQLRKYLLVVLAIFMLAGAQLAQSSPLHDHARHSVDCGLCHLQLGDDALLQPTLGVAFIAHNLPCTQYLREFLSFSNPSPYHGRAPPSSLR